MQPTEYYSFQLTKRTFNESRNAVSVVKQPVRLFQEVLTGKKRRTYAS